MEEDLIYIITLRGRYSFLKEEQPNAKYLIKIDLEELKKNVEKSKASINVEEITAQVLDANNRTVFIFFNGNIKYDKQKKELKVYLSYIENRTIGKKTLYRTYIIENPEEINSDLNIRKILNDLLNQEADKTINQLLAEFLGEDEDKEPTDEELKAIEEEENLN